MIDFTINKTYHFNNETSSTNSHQQRLRVCLRISLFLSAPAAGDILNKRLFTLDEKAVAGIKIFIYLKPKLLSVDIVYAGGIDKNEC